MKMSIDEDASKVFWVNKEKNCPLCGLKMKQLSFQLWQCKCGYRAKGDEGTEEEGEEDRERRHRLGGEADRRFREQKQPLHKGLRPM